MPGVTTAHPEPAPAAPPPPPAGEPPDWDALSRDVVCPLCEYNLRGLVEPRCPECGHTFDWQDILNAGLHIHPYLFEHHPRHNVRSFFRTLLGSALPQQFWHTLKTTHRPIPRRLLRYW